MLALGSNTLVLAELLSDEHAVLLAEQFECQVNALEFAARDVDVASLRSTCRDDVCVVALGQSVGVDVLVVEELDSLLLHDIDATVDDVLVQLEVRDAKSKESADVFEFFKNSDIISHFVEVVSSSKSGGTGADDGNFFPVTVVFLRLYESFTESSLSDSTFVFTNSDRSVHAELKNATHFAESGADTPGKLRKVVC